MQGQTWLHDLQREALVDGVVLFTLELPRGPQLHIIGPTSAETHDPYKLVKDWYLKVHEGVMDYEDMDPHDFSPSELRVLDALGEVPPPSSFACK